MKKYLFVSASIAALGHSIAPAFAQGATDPSSAQASDRRMIDTITVTSQKREQNIQDVPISVTAITGDFIEESGVQDLIDLSFIVPNLSVNSGGQFAGARINIRGVSSTSNSGIEPSVGIFVDGAYVPRPAAILGNLFDIQQVEVLRGPQGTLFGRNTPVGALNVLTRKPENEFGGSLTAELSSFGSYGVKGHITGPLTDTLSGRLAISYDDAGPYMENAFSGEDEIERQDFGARGRLLWDVSDAIEADLVVDYQKLDNTGTPSELIRSTVTQNFIDTVQNVYGETLELGGDFDRKINQIEDEVSTLEQIGATFTINFDIGDHTLTSITAYRDWDQNSQKSLVRLPLQILPRNRVAYAENISQELRLSSPEGQLLEYVAGLFLYDEDYGYQDTFDFTETFCDLTITSIRGGSLAGLQDDCNADLTDTIIDTFTQELNSIAAFGQATFNVTDALSFTGGLRWTRDEKTGTYQRATFNPAAVAWAAFDETVPDLEWSGDAVNWLASARLFATDDVMFFFTTSTGFKSGGFNSNPGSSSRIFDEENSTTYEAGVKSTLFGNLMTANATLYRTDIDDFQQRAFDGISFEVLNAGSVRQQGVELDIRTSPVEQLDVLIGVAYLDSKYLDFTGAPGLPGGSPQDLTGETRPGSPKWNGSVSASWIDRVPGTSVNWFTRAEYQYVGEQNYNTNLNPQSVQEAFDLVNLRIGLSSLDDNWKITGFVRNAFDKGYCHRIINQVAGGFFGAVTRSENTTAQRCILGRPRTFGVEVAANF